MSTSVYEVSQSISLRRQEIEVLANEAAKAFDNNDLLYKSLCRACCVMIASHLEGFVKDLTKSLVRDFNYNYTAFSDMPEAMQHTFCKKIAFYEGVEPREIDLRVSQLKAFFANNPVSIDLDAFTYKQTQNKNPSVDAIDAAFAKLGVPNVLGSLSGSSLEVVFDNDHRTNYKVMRDLKRLRSTTYNFPYRKSSDKINFDFKKPKDRKGKQPDSIWHTFVEEVMTRRHKIAHGDTMDNITTHETLLLDAVKLETLMHGILLSATEFLTS
jgi:hypothetical protein